MSKPYDASTKFLVDHYLADWLAFSQRPPVGPVHIIDADLSTITAAADKVLRIEDPVPWIFHLELQAGRDNRLAKRIHWYNALLEYRHDVLVQSTIVLLRREADAPDLNGELLHQFPDQNPYRLFRYQVTRVWELSIDSLLGGGLGLLPLAPLCDQAANALPEVIRRMNSRIEQESRDAQSAATLWTAADVLMGLRYERAVIDQIMKGVSAMKESVTYQAIVEEGRVEGRVEGSLEALRLMLLRLGRKKFGSPDSATKKAIESITDLEKLEELGERLLEVGNWEELLA